MSKTDEKKPINWASIEQDYRAGIKSLRQLSSEYGPSHVAIKKRADREGWVKDLTAKIQQAAAEKVNRDAVNREVNAETKAAERDIIEANAQLQADLIRTHRQDIQRARRLAMKLLGELEHQTDFGDLYEQLGELLRKEDDKGQDKLNDLYHKIISHPGRTDSIKKLSETLKNLIGLERQAFSLKEDMPEDPAAAAARGAAAGVLQAFPGLATVRAKLDAVLNDSGD